MYFAFGDVDAYVIADVPDAESAAAISLIVGGSGAINIEMTPLLTPEQIDEAAKKHPSFRPPGT